MLWIGTVTVQIPLNCYPAITKKCRKVKEYLDNKSANCYNKETEDVRHILDYFQKREGAHRRMSGLLIFRCKRQLFRVCLGGCPKCTPEVFAADLGSTSKRKGGFYYDKKILSSDAVCSHGSRTLCLRRLFRHTGDNRSRHD